MPLDENKLRYDHHKRKSKRRKGVKKNKTGKNRGKIQVGGGQGDGTELSIECPFCTLFTTDKYNELKDTITTSFETIEEIRDLYKDGKVKQGRFKSIIVEKEKINGKAPDAGWIAGSNCKNSEKKCVADKNFFGGKAQLWGCGLTWGCTKIKNSKTNPETGVSALYNWVVRRRGESAAMVDLENLILSFKKKNEMLFTGGGGGGGPAAPISTAAQISTAAGKKPVSTISTTGAAASTSAATPAAATPAATGESVPTQEELDAKQGEIETLKATAEQKKTEHDVLEATAIQKQADHDATIEGLKAEHETEKQKIKDQHQIVLDNTIDSQNRDHSQEIDKIKKENMREITNLKSEHTKCEKEAKTFIKIGNNINFKIFDDDDDFNEGAFKVLENLKTKIDNAIAYAKSAKSSRGGQSPKSVVKSEMSEEVGGTEAGVSSLLDTGPEPQEAEPAAAESATQPEAT
jgi:hypothetical protein